MKNRVLIVSTTQGKGHGAEEVLEELLGSHSTLSLMVLAPSGSRVIDSAESMGYPVLEFPATKDCLSVNLLAVLRIRSRLKSFHLDAVHAWSLRAYEVAVIISRLMGIPALGTLHDFPQASFLGTTRRFLIRRSARSLKTLVCVSESVKSACQTGGITRGLNVIHNGCEKLEVRPRESFDTPRVGFLGMYAEWKGFEIIETWIRRSVGKLHWRLYGRPTEQNCARFRQLGTPNAELIGHREKLSIFSEIDILVHASTEKEPFGMVLIEAASAGLPVVASRAGGPEEIVEHGVTGYLFDTSDSLSGYAFLIELAEDRHLREQMGKLAQARWQRHFTREAMAKKYTELWKRVC